MYRHGTALLLEAERICKEVQRIGRDDELILKNCLSETLQQYRIE